MLVRDGLIENSPYDSTIIRALKMDPVTPVKRQDGTYAYSTYSNTDIANPVNGIEQTYNTWTTNRFVGSVYGDFKLAKGLTFRSAYSLDITFATRQIFYPQFDPVSYTHLRAHETVLDLVCRLLL